MTQFLKNQSKDQIDNYVKMLSSVGALSKLFSENLAPYLYYRAAENIFCKAFEAENKSRSDAAVDATKDNVGIGLKTFLYRKSQYEKVAEFNKTNSQYSSLELPDLIKYIAESRNERIESSSRTYELTDNVYHCVARSKNKFILYEVPMDLIDIPNIKNISPSANGNSISFEDGKNQYKFNRTKSTLLKKFEMPDETFEFDVKILDDPYVSINSFETSTLLTELKNIENIEDTSNHVILPLYTPATKTKEAYIGEKSSLNAWNAGGRLRNENEVYLRIPSWINEVYPDFFPDQDISFNLKLPNGKVLSSKVVQQGRKALTSNPNKALGEWILRTVLHIEEGEILTFEHLQELDIDSVAIYKDSEDNYSIEVKKFGSYENFVAKTAAIS